MRGSREHGVARPSMVLKRSARKPGFASCSRLLGSSERLPKQSCSCTSCRGAMCGSVETAEMPQERRGSSGTLWGSNIGSCCTTPSPAGSARAARSVVRRTPPSHTSHTTPSLHPRAYTQPTPSPIAVRESALVVGSAPGSLLFQGAPQAALGGSTCSQEQGEIAPHCALSHTTATLPRLYVVLERARSKVLIHAAPAPTGV